MAHALISRKDGVALQKRILSPGGQIKRPKKDKKLNSHDFVFNAKEFGVKSDNYTSDVEEMG